MFTKSSTDTALDREIEAALKKLESLRNDPEKYNAELERISKLDGLKSPIRLKPPSSDMMLMVTANIFGIIWMTRYEREHTITSKALGFVFRLK